MPDVAPIAATVELLFQVPPAGEPFRVVVVNAQTVGGAIKKGELATLTVTCVLHVVGIV